MEGTLRDYLRSNLDAELQTTAFSENKAQTFDFTIDAGHFLSAFPALSTDLYRKPQSVIDSIKSTLGEELHGGKLSLDVRLVNIPGCTSTKISEIGVELKEGLVQVTGTVVRCGNSKTLAASKTYRCAGCKLEFTVEADLRLYGDIPLPPVCPSRTGNRGKGKTCKGTVFEELAERTVWKDYREVKVQEAFGTVAPGRVPQAIWVVLAGNLVNVCSPGDDVTVAGRVVLRWGPLVRDKLCDVQLCVVAYSLEADEDKTGFLSQNPESTELLFHMDMLRRFASPLLGLNHIKLGLLLCAIGGGKEEVKGVVLRGHCHALIVGEPGTGKSSLLKYASQLKGRSVFTNALGTSKAGLTLSAVKEGGEWMLEAGALVLADCGICCIDDFSLFPKEDRADIFEAMEHQTMSVAKAGMVCQVKTRTTVIAACRPLHNKLDPYKDLEENTGLSTPLLSRFDLVFLLVDELNEELDELRAEFILGQGWDPCDSTALKAIVEQVSESVVTLDDTAAVLVRNYYEYARSKLEQLTVRHLESILRLVKAHAKLCRRDEAIDFDAISIILLMECSARSSSLLTSVSPDLAFQNEDIFLTASAEVREKLLDQPASPLF